MKLLRFLSLRLRKKAPEPYRDAFNTIARSLPAEEIAQARADELILCDEHIAERLDELRMEHFTIRAEIAGLTCCRCHRTGAVLGILPFYFDRWKP